MAELDEFDQFIEDIRESKHYTDDTCKSIRRTSCGKWEVAFFIECFNDHFTIKKKINKKSLFKKN